MKEVKRRLVSHKSLPTKGVVNIGLLWYIALDYFHASPVVWGIVGTIFAFIVLKVIVDSFTAEFIEL